MLKVPLEAAANSELKHVVTELNTLYPLKYVI